MKITLKGREIPRSENGDPAFRQLDKEKDSTAPKPPSVLEIFTTEEVVELVNRAIYQLEYQHNAHKVRGQRQRDREKKVRERVRQLFHTSWMKATPEQIAKAMREVEEEEKGDTTG